MDYSNQEQPVKDSSNNSWSIGSLWSGFKSGVKNITGSTDSNSSSNSIMGGKRRKHKSMKGGNPKKGMKSRTRKGRKDFVTHKGDKYYNRNGKRQTKSRSGRKGRPYSRRSRK